MLHLWSLLNKLEIDWCRLRCFIRVALYRVPIVMVRMIACKVCQNNTQAHPWRWYMPMFDVENRIMNVWVARVYISCRLLICTKIDYFMNAFFIIFFSMCGFQASFSHSCSLAAISTLAPLYGLCIIQCSIYYVMVVEISSAFAIFYNKCNNTETEELM